MAAAYPALPHPATPRPARETDRSAQPSESHRYAAIRSRRSSTIYSQSSPYSQSSAKGIRKQATWNFPSIMHAVPSFITISLLASITMRSRGSFSGCRVGTVWQAQRPAQQYTQEADPAGEESSDDLVGLTFVNFDTALRLSVPNPIDLFPTLESKTKPADRGNHRVEEFHDLHPRSVHAPRGESILSPQPRGWLSTDVFAGEVFHRTACRMGDTGVGVGRRVFVVPHAH